MHRQQKTFTPSSLVLPLLVTALVIFLASSANAQNAEPVTELPPSLDSLAAPREARLAPDTSTTNTSTVPPERNATLRMEANVEADDSTSNTRAVVNANLRADLSAKRAEWASASQERQQMLAEKRAALASSSMERKAALNAAAQERMLRLAENSTAVLTRAIERMKNISSNLRERAEDMSSRGVNTIDAIALLDQVDDLVSQAETSLSGIDVNIEYSLTAENPKEAWVDARGQFQATTEIIRTIRPLLQEVVSTLRAAIKNANDTSIEPI